MEYTHSVDLCRMKNAFTPSNVNYMDVWSETKRLTTIYKLPGIKTNYTRGKYALELIFSQRCAKRALDNQKDKHSLQNQRTVSQIFAEFPLEMLLYIVQYIPLQETKVLHINKFIESKVWMFPYSIPSISSKHILNRFAQERCRPITRIKACAVPKDETKELHYFEFRGKEQIFENCNYKGVIIYWSGHAGDKKIPKHQVFTEEDLKMVASNFF